jgi:PDZ domain-containing protein
MVAGVRSATGPAVAGSERAVKIIGTSAIAAAMTMPSPTSKVMDMSATSVSADEPVAPVPEEQRRRRLWPWIVVAVLIVVITAAFVIPTPYYLFAPGSVTPTEAAITISGHRSYASPGTVLYTTVSEQRATPALLVRAWLDSAIEVEKEQEIHPQGEHEDLIENREEMDDSKLAAIYVALTKVSYPVTVTGSGAFLVAVEKGFPASTKLRQGDVITAVDGQPVHLADDLTPLISGKPIGAPVTLTVRRGHGGATATVSTTLGRNKADTSRGYLGVQVSTADQGLKLPFHIDIDTGSVGGPSAGLAFTLGLIDRLTPGDLTGGKKVAVTGTMSPDGTVGPIGGVDQKMATVKRAGVKEFLIPKGTTKTEVREVRKIAGNDVKVYEVGTIDDALKILAPHGVPKAPALPKG